jgi:predicted ABC-type ATPase
MANPRVVVISGPNGAGKSTSAPLLLRDAHDVPHFVNADAIARGLSGFAPGLVDLEAGKLMLRRLDALAEAGESFAFETTLASRTFAPRRRKLVADGYEFHLFYLWVVVPPDIGME